MTADEYWHGDPDLLPAFEKNYVERIHREAHIYGLYNFVAFSRALTNFGRSAGLMKCKPQNYLDKPLYTAEVQTKKKITAENIDDEYKKGLNYQLDWVNALSNNK